MKIQHNARISGRIKAAVVDSAGRVVREFPWQHNLILDGGLDYFFWHTGGTGSLGFGGVNKAFAGTGTTPNSELLDGTFSQSGTTVSRDSGTGTFAAGDVGRRIRWFDGTRAKISAYISTTSVTVDVSQTVAAQALAIYNNDATALAAFEESSTTLATSPGMTLQYLDPASQTTTEMKTWIFDLRASPINYTEVGFGKDSTYFSRIVFESPVSVDTGQQLRVSYECTLADDFGIGATADELVVTGWPRPYSIASITSDGTYWTVTLAEAHTNSGTFGAHLVANGKLDIIGALPVSVAITAITSDADSFTVTAAGHGFTAADSIEIEGCSVAAYNGTWTVASVDGNNFDVTSALNPGAASDGTTRKSTPGTWYNGTDLDIYDTPSDTTLRIASASTIIPAGATGTVQNNLECMVRHPRHGFRCGHDMGGSVYYDEYLYEGRDAKAYLVREANQWTFTAFPQYTPTTHTGTGRIVNSTHAYEKHTGGDGITNTITWNIDAANYGDLKQVILVIGNDAPPACIVVTFDERQRKDDTHQLILTLERKIHAELAWPA